MNECVTISILTFSILIALSVRVPHFAIAQSTKPVSTDVNAKAKAAKTDANEEKKAAKIERFVTYAQSVPAEFSVDLLIQLVESGQIKDPKRKHDLLVESFYTAAKAKQPVKLVGLPGSAVDSRAGYKATASTAEFDALSLQSRVIRALLPLDKLKARELFSEIKLKVDPLGCEQTLAYDVDSFFSTLQAIAQTAFNDEEISRGEHFSFVENYVSKINSSNQIQPAVKILLSLKTTDLELESLSRTFGAALQAIPSDDRSFFAPWNSTKRSLDQLVSHLKQRGLPGDSIIESYRTYLVKQLSGSRCADTTGREHKKFESDLVTNFNEELRTRAYKKIAPIAEDDVQPAKRKGSARDEPYWTSAKAKSILAQLKRLRFGSATRELPDQEKSSAEWQSHLSELVRELASWSPVDEKSDEDYFHQKSVAYYSLLQTIPRESQYDGVLDEALRDFTTMLSSSPLQKEKPAEWFLHAKILIERVNSANPGERDKLVNLIYSSRSPVLHLYVQKQQLFKPPQ